MQVYITANSNKLIVSKLFMQVIHLNTQTLSGVVLTDTLHAQSLAQNAAPQPKK